MWVFWARFFTHLLHGSAARLGTYTGYEYRQEMSPMPGAAGSPEGGTSVLEWNYLGGACQGRSVLGVPALRVPLFRAGRGNNPAFHRQRLRKNGFAFPHPVSALPKRAIGIVG